jgi:hypothetical protein
MANTGTIVVMNAGGMVSPPRRGRWQVGKDFSKVAEELAGQIYDEQAGICGSDDVVVAAKHIAAALTKARADAIKAAAKVAERWRVDVRRSMATDPLVTVAIIQTLNSVLLDILSLAQPTNTKETPDA